MISANSSLYNQHNFDRESGSENQQIIEFIKTLKEHLSISLIIVPCKSRQFGKIIVS
jgi:hypothetical protein